MISLCLYCGKKAEIDKGRALDGRRAYRCCNCRRIWTYGLNGRKRQYSHQRDGYQFHNTGASKIHKHLSREHIIEELIHGQNKTYKPNT